MQTVVESRNALGLEWFFSANSVRLSGSQFPHSFFQQQSGVVVESLGSGVRLFRLELMMFFLHELGIFLCFSFLIHKVEACY